MQKAKKRNSRLNKSNFVLVQSLSPIRPNQMHSKLSALRKYNAVYFNGVNTILTHEDEILMK